MPLRLFLCDKCYPSIDGNASRLAGWGTRVFRVLSKGVHCMMTVSVTYPGLPAVVPSARLLVRSMLTASPRVDDLELIAAELITNAMQHTSTGSIGGTFTLTIHTGSSWASVEVTDTG